ncbi:E3 ubiquitin-protein ligase NEURL1-like [Hippocampus zosterae]|uniref:E3 ubiquitin-protein ligase NEURL1-like n=1 Tax=Hippocampus zosterae TaxID=109293 RepID=UPI00223E54F4|nr:E3 ubiquitin-protein ligase NEURL1-like [Hippocampus zosterae]
MGGQITRHNYNFHGPVPIAALPSTGLHRKHAPDCTVPILARSSASQHHHHHYQQQQLYRPQYQRINWHPSKHVRPTASQPPLLFHPTAKGSQIIIDESQRAVRRKGSFCNAVAFSNRSVAVNEVVRLKITENYQDWQGALRIGFTTQDPSCLDPKKLPRYSCPDLALRSGFWAKPLPEELLKRDTVISFWVTMKGRVHYRINGSTSTRLFKKVNALLPLWVLVDVYGKTKGVQFLDSEALTPEVSKMTSSDPQVKIQKKSRHRQLPVNMDMDEDGSEEDDHDGHRPVDHMPQNSHNLRLSVRGSELPEPLDNQLRLHYVHGEHVGLTDPHTAVMRKHQGPDRTLVFTSRPPDHGESVFVMLQTTGSAELSYGVTACDPATLRPQDLPADLVRLLDRSEFWAFDDLSTQLFDEDILGFEVNAAGEIVVNRNGVSLGVQLCVDNSTPLWMFFAPHKNITQLKIFGLSSHSDVQPPQRSPLSMNNTAASNANIPSDGPPNSSHSSSATGSSVTTNQLLQLILSPRSPALTKPNVVLPPTRNNKFSSPPPTEMEESASPSSPISPAPPGSPKVFDDCAICCDGAADTALYDCGHLCLCYTCALKLKQDQASCPMCRKPIRDIIKTYRSS